MNILLVNKYFFIKGGAENSFFETAKLLRRNGHDLSYFSMRHPKNFPTEHQDFFTSNVDYESSGLVSKITASMKLLYSFEARDNLLKMLAKSTPDLAHLNNIYHQLSPSILHALKSRRIPVVMSLRDYKIVCASYSMIAGGRICEACMGGRYYNCLLKSCVKNSLPKSLLNTFEMYLHHSILHIYNLVDVYISPSKFLMNKVKEMGFAGRIEHLPNFADTQAYTPSYSWGGKAIVYFGRLSKEKGLVTLIRAVKGLPIHLDIIGEGPIKSELVSLVAAEGVDNVQFHGFYAGAALKEAVSNAMFVVLPSEWYENNPRSIIEGFALGKPAIGARIGGIPELVVDGRTGLTFESGNVEDLREKIVSLASAPDKIVEYGKNARAFVERELNPEVHYEKLMAIYKSVMN